MLQGVSRTARKRHNKAAPNFLQGVMLRTQQCHTSITSKGAIPVSRQRHFSHAPNFLQRVNNTARKRHPCDTLKGAMLKTQKCHLHIAPTSFIWCQTDSAEMPWTNRTKGRAIRDQQRCLSMDALPNQFNGDTDMTQQCLDHNSPRERSWKDRRNAAIVPPLPTSLTGAITTSQKCYKVNAPREGSTTSRRNANRGLPFPTIYRGPYFLRRSAIVHSPPPNLGHQQAAEMPLRRRPITRGHHHIAEMSSMWRLANNKENKWTRDTKTRQSQ